MIKLVSKFGLLITILIILYLFISGNVFTSSPFVIAGQLLAVALNIWARLAFKKGQFSIHAEPKEGTLLNIGPYKFIRHPMYAAALLFIWSSILGHLSIANVIIGLAGTSVAIIRIIEEEKLLKSKYSDYIQYTKQTKRIIPLVF